MAQLNEKQGSIVAHCPGCRGGRSTFEWQVGGREIGVITDTTDNNPWRITCNRDFRLFRCAGCGRDAFGVILYPSHENYPGPYNKLVRFYPESKQRLVIPRSTPQGIANEFREAEKCFDNNCFRAAAGLFRSVLDKTMRANGYKTTREKNLYQQIEAAADDGVITQARKRRAHDEIRVLGNDVLHDQWQLIPEDDVEGCRHYCQRILEDFYDDRESVLKLLHEAGRQPEDLLREEQS